MYLQLGVFISAFQIVITEKCVTPNNEAAECVPLHSCEILLDALFKAECESIEFVRKSKCEGRESDRMVCCGSTSQFLAPTIKKNADKDKLLPDRTYCGYQHSDDYFRNETAIGINEFPWVAGLLYEPGGYNETPIFCSGTLISNRYVLTAASCLGRQHGGPSYDEVIGVRLGDYDSTTDEDCTEESSFYECSDPPQDFDIEKQIGHPQYTDDCCPRRNDNDIALLRLSKRVQYSDYIRPICLPTAGTVFAKPGDILLSSGWGDRDNRIPIKKKIYNQLITDEECRMHVFFRAAQLTVNHVCAHELENNTEFTTTRDRGGPMIFSFRKQWHLEAILFRPTYRSGYSKPVVYTKVLNYLDWIKETVEP